MDKLKNILKSDTPTADTVPSGNTGKLTGQGSHFPSKDETSVTAPGSTVPGTSLQTKGPSDVSAAPASSTAAAITAGPESSGSDHVNTVPATSTSAASAAPIETERSAAQQSTGGPSEYTVSSADFPKNESSGDGSGTAAIGQTSTYSSARLTQGDPTPSVVDPTSSDPLTYLQPESGSHHTEAGVGAGAAAAAAGLAFTQGEERKKDQMPGHENPYRAASLDPRVDGLPKASAVTAATTSGAASSSRDATSGSSAGVAPGAAGIGASQAFNKPQTTESAAAPSTLTTAADPAARSAEYSATTEEKGLPQTSEQAPTLPPVETNESQQGIFGKALGAVGLGGVAAAIGASSASDKNTSAVADTPDQPTTTTGLETYTAPTQQGPPTGHHRKESIPTTAYPSGTFDSPRAINQPIGGAGSPVVHGDQAGRAGSDAALTAAAGSAAVGAHEYGRSKPSREQITGESQDSAPAPLETGQASTGSVFAHHATTTTAATTTAGDYRPSQGQQENVGSAAVASPPVYTSTTERATEVPPVQPAVVEKRGEDHTGRDVAIGAGAGAAAVGAGAYGAHEYSKKEAEKVEKAEEEAAKERAAHEKELAKQKAEQEKELEHERKAAEKAAAKEEKQHQKEIEKEQKEHQKEVEKEEKKHQKELEKAEKEERHRREEAEAAALKEQKAREKEEKHRKEEAEAAALKEQRAHEKEQARLAKEREEQAEERKIREERERLAGAVGVGGATGIAADETEREREKEKEKEKEKKPNIFKRIFKRRKNKDTGEEEDYESEEEDKGHHKGAAAVGGAAVVGGGAAAYAAEHDRTAAPAAGTTTTTGATTYEEQSGGVQKPSYNPFHKDENPIVTSAPNEPGPTTATARSTTEETATYSQQPAAAVTGLPYEPKTSEPAGGLSQHQQSGEAAVFRDVAPATIESTGTHSQQPTEAITGLPYDASKDPQAAARLSQHQHGEGIGSLEPTASEKAGEFPVNTDFKLGEIQESHGLGEKIKEALHIGSSKKEGE